MNYEQKTKNLEISIETNEKELKIYRKALEKKSLDEVQEAVAQEKINELKKEISNETQELLKTKTKALREMREQLLTKEEEKSIKEADVKVTKSLKGKEKTYSFKGLNKDNKLVEITKSYKIEEGQENLLEEQSAYYMKSLTSSQGKKEYNEWMKKNEKSLINVLETERIKNGTDMLNGDTAKVFNVEQPVLLRDYILTNVYATSQALRLAPLRTINGNTIEQMIVQGFLDGFDGVEQGHVKPDVTGNVYKTKSKLTKYAGKWITTTEVLKFNEFGTELFRLWGEWAAAGLKRKIDRDFINGDGVLQLVGLASSKRGTTQLFGNDFEVIKPATKTLPKIANLITTIKGLLSSDFDVSKSIKVAVAPGILDKVFVETFGNTTISNTDIRIPVPTTSYNGFNSLTFKNIEFFESEELFSSRTTNHIVGVIVKGDALEMIQNGNIEILNDNGYSRFDKNETVFVAEWFIQLVVKERNAVYLIKDGETKYATVDGTPTKATITFTVDASLNGKTLTLNDLNGDEIATETAAAGKVAFTGITGHDGQEVRLLDDNGWLIGQSKLGA